MNIPNHGKSCDLLFGHFRTSYQLWINKESKLRTPDPYPLSLLLPGIALAYYFHSTRQRSRMRGQRMTIYSMNHRERPPRVSRSKAQSVRNVALDDQVSAFYRNALETLQDDGLNVLVGGAFALRH